MACLLKASKGVVQAVTLGLQVIAAAGLMLSVGSASPDAGYRHSEAQSLFH
jgi:hypothetical protein